MNKSTPSNPKPQPLPIQEQIDELREQMQLIQEHLGIADPTGRAGHPFESAESRLKKLLAKKKK
jgi:hypothetical protein